MGGCAWSRAWEAFLPRPRSCMSEIVGQICFRSAEACRATQTHFLVRAFEHRRIEPEEQPQKYLLDEVRAWPAQASRPLQVPASHGRTARSTVVQLAFGTQTILPPRGENRTSAPPRKRVGDSGLGRADSRRRRAVGVDSVDLGLHDDARARMPSASGGMSTAGSWRSI
jgi:hypothetical protein